MRVVAAIAVLVSLISFSVNADLALSGSAAVEVTKKCQDATKKNIDASWIRAELKAKGTLAKSPLNGMIQLRIQPNIAGGVKGIDVQPRQIYLNLPVSILDITAGRWYEAYGQEYNYFGRYLYGVSATGNGSMNTNYALVDGFKMKLNVKVIKSAFQVAYLPGDLNFESSYLSLMFGGNPIEALKFNIGGNFQVQTIGDADAVNRFMVNCGYTIVKDLGLGLFGEYAITDFNEASKNMWFVVGIKSKAGVVLDNIQAEFEIKNHRNKDKTTDGNLAWMVMLQKKAMGLTFDLNVGADPTVLGSKKAGDVGTIFRVGASF